MWTRRVLLATMVAAAALVLRNAPALTPGAGQQAPSGLVMLDK